MLNSLHTGTSVTMAITYFWKESIMLQGKKTFCPEQKTLVPLGPCYNCINVNVIKNSQLNQFTGTLSIILWVTVQQRVQQRSFNPPKHKRKSEVWDNTYIHTWALLTCTWHSYEGHVSHFSQRWNWNFRTAFSQKPHTLHSNIVTTIYVHGKVWLLTLNTIYSPFLEY